jgi:hypothetical protein
LDVFTPENIEGKRNEPVDSSSHSFGFIRREGEENECSESQQFSNTTIFRENRIAERVTYNSIKKVISNITEHTIPVKGDTGGLARRSDISAVSSIPNRADGSFLSIGSHTRRILLNSGEKIILPKAVEKL